MTVYGLKGFTHGWAATLTVMSPHGASRALRKMGPGDAIITRAGAGRLTHYLEKRSGALDRFIHEHGVVILSKAEWDAKKIELGETIYT